MTYLGEYKFVGGDASPLDAFGLAQEAEAFISTVLQTAMLPNRNQSWEAALWMVKQVQPGLSSQLSVGSLAPLLESTTTETLINDAGPVTRCSKR